MMNANNISSFSITIPIDVVFKAPVLIQYLPEEIKQIVLEFLRNPPKPSVASNIIPSSHINNRVSVNTIRFLKNHKGQVEIYEGEIEALVKMLNAKFNSKEFDNFIDPKINWFPIVAKGKIDFDQVSYMIAHVSKSKCASIEIEKERKQPILRSQCSNDFKKLIEEVNWQNVSQYANSVVLFLHGQRLIMIDFTPLVKISEENKIMYLKLFNQDSEIEVDPPKSIEDISSVVHTKNGKVYFIPCSKNNSNIPDKLSIINKEAIDSILSNANDGYDFDAEVAGYDPVSPAINPVQVPQYFPEQMQYQSPMTDFINQFSSYQQKEEPVEKRATKVKKIRKRKIPM